VSRALRVLIVDDDPLARERLRVLLAAEDGVARVDERGDGVEGVEALKAEAYDLVFLDVQMPRLDGFGVIEAIGAERMPVVVFSSAYVEFAIRAFDACALDYLLKPFADERFHATLRRAREAVEHRSGADPRMEALLGMIHAPERVEYPERLAVKVGEQYRLLDVRAIDAIQADGNHVRLRIEGRETLLHKTLSELEERVLDPRLFVRIHRSTIVNLSRIAALEPLFHGELSVVMKDGTRLTCSRRHRPKLQERVLFIT